MSEASVGGMTDDERDAGKRRMRNAMKDATPDKAGAIKEMDEGDRNTSNSQRQRSRKSPHTAPG